MRKLVLLLACASGLLATAAATAAGPPPPPKAVAGKHVRLVAAGVPTPTSFAFAGRTVFVSAGGGEGKHAAPGGVFVVKGSKAVRIPGSPPFVAGITWRAGTLYVSAGGSLLAWSGWNGKTFTHRRAIVSMQPPFTGFSGVAVGPDGALYTGVMLSQAKAADYSAGTTPYANDVLRVDPRTGAIAVVATGLRQPWQLAFVHGYTRPFVSTLGQENLGKHEPPDLLVHAALGSSFGFPQCNWSDPAACAGYAKPFALFPAHASPMGIGVAGNELYVALFGGTGHGPEIVRANVHGGRWMTFASGYVAPVLAVGVRHGAVFTGDLTGSIYEIW